MLVAVVPLTLALADAGKHARPRPPAGGAAAQGPHTERLRYQATWNGLPVADAELLIQPGRDTVTLRARAETNEALDLLWQMRDSVEATVRLNPVRPARFALHQNENDRRYETTIVSDDKRMVGTVERGHRKTRRAEVPLTPTLHDPASLAYLIRTLPPDMAHPASYQVLAGTKIYGITVAPAGTERIDVAERTWKARRFHLTLQLVPTDVEPTPAAVPAAASDGASDAAGDAPEREERRGNHPGRPDLGERRDQPKVQEADLWLSADAERLPLQMRAESFWGWVTIELESRSAVQ